MLITLQTIDTTKIFGWHNFRVYFSIFGFPKFSVYGVIWAGKGRETEFHIFSFLRPSTHALGLIDFSYFFFLFFSRTRSTSWSGALVFSDYWPRSEWEEKKSTKKVVEEDVTAVFYSFSYTLVIFSHEYADLAL